MSNIPKYKLLLLQFNPSRTRRSDRGHCGAKTRKGSPCQAPPVWNKWTDLPRNGRCKLHGGLSTGPKTEAGKNAIRMSNINRGKKRATL